MKSKELGERTERIKQALETLAHVRGEDRPFAPRGPGRLHTSGWIFDFRNILLRAPILEDAAAIFWDIFGNEETQVGSIETAGIPLVTGLIVHGAAYGKQKHASGFYIRKSRKKDGLMQMIEGTIEKDKRIVLVDDIINSGSSCMRQVEVVESLGYRVSAIWVFVRYRDLDYYEYFHKKGIRIYSLFELNDLEKTLGTKNLTARKERPPLVQAFDVIWKFKSKDPSYQHVVPKSDPVLDTERVYFGSDSGVFWALNQEDGSVAWSHKIGLHPKGKGIFSSPALYDSLVYFGAYDGNVYALEAATGKKKWVSFEGDWIGSSPALAPELGLLFIGLEFGLWRKRGGIAALDMTTGKRVWASYDMPCYTHSSPLYIQKYGHVIIGSNDGCARLFDGKTGALIWKFQAGTLQEEELNSGFSALDIKGSCAYDPKRDLLIFGNTNADLFFVDRKSGAERGRFKAEFGFYSTPLVHENAVIATSLDKRTYCIDLDTFAEKWRWNAGARIFATPVLIDGSLYIGANTGRLTELEPKTGEVLSTFTVTERITNKVAYNPATKKFFLPTYANELYCLKKAPAAVDTGIERAAATADH